MADFDIIEDDFLPPQPSVVRFIVMRRRGQYVDRISRPFETREEAEVYAATLPADWAVQVQAIVTTP
jgi:hypothetical protein